MWYDYLTAVFDGTRYHEAEDAIAKPTRKYEILHRRYPLDTEAATMDAMTADSELCCSAMQHLS